MEISTYRARRRAAAALLAALLVAVAAIVTLTSTAAARPAAAKKQRVAWMTGAGRTTLVSDIALFPLQAGPLKADSGKIIAKSHEGDDPVTFKGRRGTLVFTTEQKWTDVGRGFGVATGTWKVVRGTGQYAGVTGGGTSLNVWYESTDDWTERGEGVLRLP